MESDLQNKILVVTGGAGGVGFEITKHFLKAGVKLAIILDIDEVEGNHSAQELNAEFGLVSEAVFLKCNVVEDLEEIYKTLCEQFVKFDILVNCAGIFNEADPDQCVQINLTASIKWSLKFVELFGKNNNGNGGTIINVATIFGSRVSQNCPVYLASKFGVFGFTKSLGHQTSYQNHGVRVIGLCPRSTDTNMTMMLNGQCVIQRPDVVGENAVKTYQMAESGTVWVIEDGVMEEVSVLYNSDN